MVIDETGGWGSPATGPGSYTLSATVQTSDGSVFGPTGQVITVASPAAGGASTYGVPPNGILDQSVILGTTTNQYGNVQAAGSLRYDLPLNSIASATFMLG